MSRMREQARGAEASIAAARPEPARNRVDSSAGAVWDGPMVRQACSIGPCPQCGFDMVSTRGSKDAVCGNCGFKDSCCY
jgi:hypothetical protein